MSFNSQITAGPMTAGGAVATTGPAKAGSNRVPDEARRRGAQIAEPYRYDSLPLTRLIGYVIDKHHVYARRQVAGIGALLADLTAGGEREHPETARVRRLFKVLRQELLFHMEKEEVSIFPRIIRSETADFGDELSAAPHTGQVLDSIRMLTHEHDQLCSMLDEIRAVTNDYTPPQGACEAHEALYRDLRDLELDLLQHLHLEDNVLFPRALGAERRGRG